MKWTKSVHGADSIACWLSKLRFSKSIFLISPKPLIYFFYSFYLILWVYFSTQDTSVEGRRHILSVTKQSSHLVVQLKFIYKVNISKQLEKWDSDYISYRIFGVLMVAFMLCPQTVSFSSVVFPLLKGEDLGEETMSVKCFIYWGAFKSYKNH